MPDLRRLLLVAVLCTAGCLPGTDTQALRRCDADDPTVDCCSDADECLTYYGSDFPYCATPGDETGRCVECTIDEHCDLESYCEITAPQGPFCAPLADR